MKKIFLLFLAVAAVGCQEPENSLKISIEGMEEKIKDDEVVIDSALANTLTESYLEYARTYPEDSLSPYYRLRAGDIFKELPQKQITAINTYRALKADYPNHAVAARASFMEAYVFDEKLDDRLRAIKSYERFLEEFPNHPLASDAKNLLLMASDTLSDEERVQHWLLRDSISNPNPQE